MNKNELKAQMARHGDTNMSLAKAMKMSYAAFSAKLNSKKIFKQSEIQIIVDRYELTAEEIKDIFFTPQMS